MKATTQVKCAFLRFLLDSYGALPFLRRRLGQVNRPIQTHFQWPRKKGPPPCSFTLPREVRRGGSCQKLAKNAFRLERFSLVVIFAIFMNSVQVRGEDSSGIRQTIIHTWENVGEITQISGKTFTIQRTLKISNSSWSLEPGAVAEASQMQSGDQILTKGKTQTDGTFDARRIYLISPSATRQQGNGGVVVAQNADHGGPETKYPRGLGDPTLESRGRGYPGAEKRVPGPGTPGGGSKGPPGGLQTSRGPRLPRFLPGDVEGIIEQVNPDQIILSQTFFFDKDTSILGVDRKAAKRNDLQLRSRVAVTIRDEIDQKTQARRATVIRLLP